MIIFIDPMGAPRQVRSDTWRPRARIIRYRAYRDKIIRELGGYNITNFPESLSVKFIIAMPESWSMKKKHNMLGKPHQQKPDIDNLVKGLLDAVFRDSDDAHVWRILTEKVWGETGKIQIEELQDNSSCG